MRVLIACEESQAVTKEFRERGHEAYSCDIIECSGGKPKKGSPSAKYYGDGSCPKDDAQCFSLYLRKTTKQEKLESEFRRKRWAIENDWRVKYQALQTKYNTMMLKPLLQGLVDNVEELQYAVEKGQYPNNIIHSLKGIAEGITEDINNKLEV